jgi:hypothetical protein
VTFDSEETQTLFHELPTQTQYDWICVEEVLRTMGYQLQVRAPAQGSKDGTALEMVVEISEQLIGRTFDRRNYRESL